jgi:hypothetical protein
VTLPPPFSDRAAFPSDEGPPADGPGPARLAGVFVITVAASAALGVLAGFGWAAVAPRPLLMMTGRDMAELVNGETTAFISADASFCLICLAGGVISGLLGYLFMVRRHGPVAMAGVLTGALAAAFTARWVGERSGLATFHHLLATLPVGAHLHDSLTLGAGSAVAFWPLAAGLVAGGLELYSDPRRRGISLGVP